MRKQSSPYLENGSSKQWAHRFNLRDACTVRVTLKLLPSFLIDYLFPAYILVRSFDWSLLYIVSALLSDIQINSSLAPDVVAASLQILTNVHRLAAWLERSIPPCCWNLHDRSMFPWFRRNRFLPSILFLIHLRDWYSLSIPTIDLTFSRWAPIGSNSKPTAFRAYVGWLSAAFTVELRVLAYRGWMAKYCSEFEGMASSLIA